MKNILLYMLFSLFVLVMFSCRRQDTSEQEQDSLHTDGFVWEEAKETETSQHIDNIEIDSGYEYVIPEAKDELDSCISPALRKCIIAYIDRYYKEDFDDYCCIYFFKKKIGNYFTIWMLDFPLKKWIEIYYPNASFLYYWFIMHKKEIILIFNPDSNQLLPFNSCINQLGVSDVTYLPAVSSLMAKNLFYCRTYKYTQQDNDFYIEPLKDTIYMGNNQGLAYELRYLKRENGLPEK